MITVFMQHAKNFVSKDCSKRVFQGVMFDGENAIVSDTRQLVVIPFRCEPKVVDYKTGAVIKEERIPDFKRIISAENDEKIVIDRDGIRQWISTLKTAQKVNGTQIPFCCIEGERLIVKTPDVEFSARLQMVSRTESATFTLQIPYLLNLMKFLNDVSEEYFDKVVFEIPTPNKEENPMPVIIKAGEVTAAISQVRVFGQNRV